MGCINTNTVKSQTIQRVNKKSSFDQSSNQSKNTNHYISKFNQNYKQKQLQYVASRNCSTDHHQKQNRRINACINKRPQQNPQTSKARKIFDSNNIKIQKDMLTINTQDTISYSDTINKPEKTHYINLDQIHKNPTKETYQNKQIKQYNSKLNKSKKAFQLAIAYNNQSKYKQFNKKQSGKISNKKTSAGSINQNNNSLSPVLVQNPSKYNYKTVQFSKSENDISHYRSPRGSKNNIFKTFKDNCIQEDQPGLIQSNQLKFSNKKNILSDKNWNEQNKRKFNNRD